MLELLLPLAVGGQVVLASRDEAVDGQALRGLVESSQATVMQATPATWRLLIDAGWRGGPGFKALVGGEGLPLDLAQQLLERVGELWNMYGPTETTVWSTCWKVEQPEQGISIGRPIANTQVHILDGQGEVCPIGVPGEMYIGGDGVARGYLHRPELTAERFVADPFAGGSGGTLYRTGDRGRWRQDGLLEHLGRLDFQVKVRGYRIELGEIETALNAQPGVQQCVVVVREDHPGLKRLVAYTVGAELDRTEVRRRLGGLLPEYMVPSAFVVLPTLPTLPNGKLDRKALPAPDLADLPVRLYEPPQGEIEIAIAALWQELMGLERVGRHDHFFELGGHSLMLVTLIQRMRRVGLETDVRTVFANQTLSALARAVGQRSPDRRAGMVPPNRIPAGCAAIDPAMLPLVELTQSEIDAIVAAVPGGAGNVQDIYPLTGLQEGMLFHHLLETEGDAYLGRWVMVFDTRSGLDRFLGALQTVIDRHDALRTAVMWEGLSHPVQVVVRRAVLPVEEVARPDGGMMDHLLAVTDPRKVRLALHRAPLLAAYTGLDPVSGEWVLAFLIHHVVRDHTSKEVLLGEIEAVLLGHAHTLPEPVPFRDFVAQSRAVPPRAHEEYFRRVLGDFEEPSTPFGLVDVRGDGREIEDARVLVEAELASRVRSIARRESVSPAVLFHVAWALVVARCSGRDDVVFGTVLSGRLQGSAGADRVVGLLMNTLPMRLTLSGLSVRQAVADARHHLSELVQHETASLALAQRCSAVPAQRPLFSAMINYRHSQARRFRDGGPAPAGLAGTRKLGGRERTNYPVAVSIDDSGQDFTITGHCPITVDPKRLAAYVETAVEALVGSLESAPDTSVLDLGILPAGERHQVLVEWNTTARPYSTDVPVPRLIEEQAARAPEAVAVQIGDQRLSYRELNSRANRLAHELHARGVGPEVMVGVCMERSLALVVALLAVLKAGGAFVPLDPEYPTDRLALILDDTAAPVVLTQSHLLDRLPAPASAGVREVLCLDTHWDLSASGEDTNPVCVSEPQHLAYVIYTSGSTGQPKGVLLLHRGLCNHVSWLQEQLQVQPSDRFLQIASISFDASLVELILPLRCGATIVLTSPGEHRDPAYLAGVMRDQNVTILQMVPSALSSMLGEPQFEGGSLRYVISGGEALDPALLQELQARLPRARLGNFYGPTETSIDATQYEIPRPLGCASTVPIGRPIANTQCYVLDARPAAGTGGRGRASSTSAVSVSRGATSTARP